MTDDFKCKNCGSELSKNDKICIFCGQVADLTNLSKTQTEEARHAASRALSPAEKALCAGAKFMDKTALLKAGIVYAEGVGVPKNSEVAKHLLHEAAIKGSGEAMFRYAEFLEQEDLETAVWWYLQAAKNGSVAAKNTLGERLKRELNASYTETESIAGGESDLKTVVGKVSPYCVELTCSSSSDYSSSGSGCIINPKFVLTNAHVVMDERTGEPHKKIVLNFNKNINISRQSLEFVACDPREDIAICAMTGEIEGSFPEFRNAQNLVCGEKVFTIGNALGRGLALSCGVVSKEVESGCSYGKKEVLQTDMSINGGNSGGALFDSDGNIVGMMTFVPLAGDSTRAYGMSFAVTSNTIVETINNWMKK